MIRYERRSLLLQTNDSEAIETYGITVYEHGDLLFVIDDISLDKEKIDRLVECFNKERLSPSHLDEALENFLYDFEI